MRDSTLEGRFETLRSMGKHLLDLFPRAQLHVIAGGDHDLVEVYAQRLAPIIDAHLASRVRYLQDFGILSMLKSFLSLLFIISLAGCHTAPSRPTSIGRGDGQVVENYIAQKIEYEMARTHIPGLSIALVDNQKVVWAKGFGLANREKGIPATAQTLYRVGSISKLLTVVAALQLVEAGKLDLDQPIQHWLPELSLRAPDGSLAKISIRQLMSHHAGLARDRIKGSTDPEGPAFSALVDAMAGEELPFQPGELFSYSNLGITLLGEIVQRVSGKPFPLQLEESVLKPLGMGSAAFASGVLDNPWMAAGYEQNKPAHERFLRDIPAGGMTASVLDLARFLSMTFAEGKSGGLNILQPASVAEMLRPQNIDVPLDLNFHVGLGWMLSSLGSQPIPHAGRIAHHAGATHLFRSQIYVSPEHKLGVVVLANSSEATQVVDSIARETLALALEERAAGVLRSTSAAEQKIEAIPVDLARLPGLYTTIAGTLRITPKNDALQAELNGRKFKLLPRADGLLGLSYSLLGLIDIDLGPLLRIGFSRRVVSGRGVLIARDADQEMLIGERLPAPPPAGAWLQRLGDYRIINLAGDWAFAKRIRLLKQDGYLFVEMTFTEPGGQSIRVALQPLSDDEARLTGPLADRGERLKVTRAGDRETLWISGYQLQRLMD